MVSKAQQAARDATKRKSDAFQDALVQTLKSTVDTHGEAATLRAFDKAVKKARTDIFDVKPKAPCKVAVPNVTVFKKVFCDSPEKGTSKKLLEQLVKSVDNSVERRDKVADPDTTRKGCILPNFKKSDKRPFITLTDSRKAMWVKCGGDDRGEIEMTHILLSQREWWPKSNHDHASHLCSNGLCVNADHLEWVPSLLNDMRKPCVANKKCSGHEGAKDCIL